MKIHSVFLTYFNEVCKSGSIRQAAKNLFIASSAVNRQILKKEEELGVKLFERSHNGIVLTEAGKILQEHVNRTLSDYDRTMRELDVYRNSKSTEIRIVGQESVVSNFLPPIFLELQNQFPGIATTFIAANGRKLNDYLLKGQADIALSFDPVLDQNIKQLASIELAVGAIVSPSHPLAKFTSISLSECTDYPLVLPDESWPLRDLLDEELAKISANNDIINITSNSIGFLRSMIGKKSRIGFQTIIGLEDPIREGSLIHIPLVSENHEFTQAFSVCVNSNQEITDVKKSILKLLYKRLEKYTK